MLFLLSLLFLGNHEFSCKSFSLSKLAASVLYCKELHYKFSVMQKKKKKKFSKYLFQGQLAFISETREPDTQ